MGLTPVRKALQKDSIDDKLRNQLWNIYYETFFDRIEMSDIFFQEDKTLDRYLMTVWEYYYNNRIDELPTGYELYRHIKDYFFKCNWYEVYDFIEFTINRYNTSKKTDNEWIIYYIEFTNKVLDKHLSAYKIIDKKICPITSEIEIQSIEKALEYNDEFRAVNIHLNCALELLSDRNKPNYRNSIKESISAIESLCRIITGDEKVNFGKGMAIIENSLGLHKSLTKAFTKIYGYTSDEKGIRHSLLDEDNVKFEDAKFMLVSCSAFVNYLILKQANAPVKEVVAEAN